MESVVLLLVILAPWAFGGVDPVFELLIAAGVVLVLGLWAALTIINGRFNWVRCPAAICIGGITLLGMVQLIPLPPAVLQLISPGTSQLYTELMPTHPELVAAGDTPAVPPANHAISVYPEVTRADAVRWLAIFVLFGAVRSQLATTASFRRLCIAVLINGALLTIFGMAQFFSTNHTSVYWSFESAGQVFGPFINRNHFATYANLSLALGVGYLLTLGPTESERRRRLVQKPNALEEQDEVDTFFSPFSVLHSPMQLWACVGLALLLSGVLCSLSRGGVATLFLALILVLVIRFAVGPRFQRLELFVLPILLLLGLLAWTGIKPLETRLAALWQGTAFDESRWSIWTRLLTLFPKFPLAGSGLGSLPFIEPIARSTEFYYSPTALYVVDHAHNEYVEALVEGGALRLALTIAVIGFVVTHGIRALRRWIGRTPGALAFGGLFAILALALHSFVEFSISTPAVGILAAVIAAQLMSLSRSDPTATPSAAHSGVLYLRLGVAGRIAIGIAFAVVGLVLILQTWQADRVHRLRLGAFHAVREKPPDFDRAFQLLAAAARVAPGNAEAHLELGLLYVDYYQRSLQVRDAATRRLAEQLLQPGLREIIVARNLCPLLARTHMRLAAHAAEMSSADPPAAYWARARRLAPYDADLWYFSGVQALREGRIDDAWADWKHSLALSPKHLVEILDAVESRLSPDQILARILPDNPVALYEASRRLEKNVPRVETTKPFLERAAVLLDALTTPTAYEYYLKARVYRLLGQPEKSLSAYKSAISVEPSQLDWREEYARYLDANRLYKEAYEQIKYIVGHRAAPTKEFELFKQSVENELK